MEPGNSFRSAWTGQHLRAAGASHVRVGDPLFSHVLFPAYVGTLLWVGLFLRDARLRTLLTRKGALR